jgi:hypothetical protein
MQKLALMMAVMILGMSPAHGCSISADPGIRGVKDQAEMTLPPSTWPGGDGKTLMTKDKISSAAAEGNPPVEPGGAPDWTNLAADSARGRRPGKDKE